MWTLRRAVFCLVLICGAAASVRSADMDGLLKSMRYLPPTPYESRPKFKRVAVYADRKVYWDDDHVGQFLVSFVGEDLRAKPVALELIGELVRPGVEPKAWAGFVGEGPLDGLAELVGVSLIIWFVAELDKIRNSLPTQDVGANIVGSAYNSGSNDILPRMRGRPGQGEMVILHGTAPMRMAKGVDVRGIGVVFDVSAGPSLSARAAVFGDVYGRCVAAVGELLNGVRPQQHADGLKIYFKGAGAADFGEGEFQTALHGGWIVPDDTTAGQPAGEVIFVPDPEFRVVLPAQRQDFVHGPPPILRKIWREQARACVRKNALIPGFGELGHLPLDFTMVQTMIEEVLSDNSGHES